jgi:hypothetical protein
MADAERAEYRIIYNWAKGAHEICEVWSLGDEPPHAYAEVVGVGTHDDDGSLGEDADPVVRLRSRLAEMLTACDKPVLKFPEDFAS